MELNVHEFFYSSLGSIYTMMVQDMVGNDITPDKITYINILKELLQKYRDNMSFKINIPYTIYYHPLAFERFVGLPEPQLEDIEYTNTTGQTVITKTRKKLTHNLITNITKLGKHTIKAAIMSPKLLNNLMADAPDAEMLKKDITKIDIGSSNITIDGFVDIVSKYNDIDNDIKASDQILEDAFKSMRRFIGGSKMTHTDFLKKYDYLINEHLLYNSFLLQLSKSSQITIKDTNVFISTLGITKQYKKNNVTGLWDQLINCIREMGPSNHADLTPELKNQRQNVVDMKLKLNDDVPRGFNELLHTIKSNVKDYFKI